jgi:hypothetical protein
MSLDVIYFYESAIQAQVVFCLTRVGQSELNIHSNNPIDQRSLSGDLIEPATQVVDEHGEAMLLFEAMKFGWEMRSENVKQVDDEPNF